MGSSLYRKDVCSQVTASTILSSGDRDERIRSSRSESTAAISLQPVHFSTSCCLVSVELVVKNADAGVSGAPGRTGNAGPGGVGSIGARDPDAVDSDLS